VKIVKVNLVPKEKSSANPRMYFWQKGESVMDNLRNRRGRPHDEYRKLIPDVLKQVFDVPQTYKARWSQYAGCACPCSPGFIVSGLTGTEYDIHVDFSE
jgi:hypothetical protein